MKLRQFATAFGLGLSLMAGAVQAQPLNLTLSGASPGGLWSLLGAGLDRAVKAADPASVVTYQATGGGFANIALLAANRSDLGLAHDAEIKLALAGTEPFREPVTNLRAIGTMYNWAPMHFFLNKAVAERHGIQTLADIATSGAPIRIGVNRPGNITGDVALGMLEAAGVTEESIRANGGTIVRAASAEQADLLRDGRIDLVTNGIFVGHSSFRAIDENNDVILLTIPDDVIAAMSAQFGTIAFTIPGGSYSNQPEDAASLALGAVLIASETMSEDAAHSLTSALIAHVDEVRGVHGAMRALDTALLAAPTVVPFHPGAERAFREAGLLQ
ncbi:MAG: TAXI family TRAP transporter solute-binding subunit [Rhodobacteraceae bacterium]|nr:TAXI family TRAP transporter solute-binding subunit [Paracoccaceae bacterium]